MSKPVTFNPGPSALYPFVGEIISEALASGILEASHRSTSFVRLFFETQDLLYEKLNLPRNYATYFLSSATEAWNVVAEGYVQQKSAHYFSGNFGRKWYDYTKNIHPQAVGRSFSPNENPDVLPEPDVELVALTHNETSNGSRVDGDVIAQVKRGHPHALIAVDATSSMAGTVLNFEAADIWFASVQKCFGLPAGLAVMFASPGAVEKMRAVAFVKRYNAVQNLHKMSLVGQTVYTPNVLGIFLLNGVLKRIEGINTIHRRIEQRAMKIYQIANAHFHPLINNPNTRSYTVASFRCDSPDTVKQDLLNQANILLGSGYGELKHSSFRVANFPALDDETFYNLVERLNNY